MFEENNDKKRMHGPLSPKKKNALNLCQACVPHFSSLLAYAKSKFFLLFFLPFFFTTKKFLSAASWGEWEVSHICPVVVLLGLHTDGLLQCITGDGKSKPLISSHLAISDAVSSLKKKRIVHAQSNEL